MADLSFADILRKYGAELFSLGGALVGLSFVERPSPWLAALALLSGFLVGVVGGPICAHYIEPPAAIRDYVIAGCALALSIVGFVLAGTLHATALKLKEWVPELLRKIVERKTGG